MTFDPRHPLPGRRPLVAGAARSFDMMNYLPRVVSTEDIYELIKSAF